MHVIAFAKALQLYLSVLQKPRYMTMMIFINTEPPHSSWINIIAEDIYVILKKLDDGFEFCRILQCFWMHFYWGRVLYLDLNLSPT